MYWFTFQTNFVRQKTPHPKELKAKAHKLFGNKKGEQIQQNGENFTAQENGGEDAPVNENHNGVGPASVVFRDGIGIQQTSNGDYEDDGDIGDDENEEVRFNITICLIVVLEFPISIVSVFYERYCTSLYID